MKKKYWIKVLLITFGCMVAYTRLGAFHQNIWTWIIPLALILPCQFLAMALIQPSTGETK